MYALIVNSLFWLFCLDVKPGIFRCKITARLTRGIVSNVLSWVNSLVPLPLYKIQIVFETKYLQIFILFVTCNKLGSYLHKHVLRLAELMVCYILTIMDHCRFPCVVLFLEDSEIAFTCWQGKFYISKHKWRAFCCPFFENGNFVDFSSPFCKSFNVQQDNLMCFQSNSANVKKNTLSKWQHLDVFSIRSNVVICVFRKRAQREKEERQREEELLAQQQREAEAAAAAEAQGFIAPGDQQLVKYTEEVRDRIQPLPTSRDQVVALAQCVNNIKLNFLWKYW